MRKTRMGIAAAPGRSSGKGLLLTVSPLAFAAMYRVLSKRRSGES
jgi:hypothetical protein